MLIQQEFSRIFCENYWWQTLCRGALRIFSLDIFFGVRIPDMSSLKRSRTILESFEPTTTQSPCETHPILNPKPPLHLKENLQPQDPQTLIPQNPKPQNASRKPAFRA